MFTDNVPNPSPTPTSTPTPTPTITPGPINDFDYLIIPNNDLDDSLIPNLDINLIPNNDLNINLIPNNDININLIPDNDLETGILVGFTFRFIPNNDFNDNQIPNDGLGSEIIPNNDFIPEILEVTGGCFNLITLPYFYPESGNIIFPEFSNPGSSEGILNPNTFSNNGVNFNFIDNQGNNLFDYFIELLSNNYLIYFSQNGNTAIYEGNPLSFSNEFGGLINGGINPGTSELVLVQPSPVDFIQGEPVCIWYEILPSPTPTPTPTMTETPTNTPTPTITETPTNTPTETPTPTPTQIPVNLIMNLDSTVGISSSEWLDETAYNNDATINGTYSLTTFNGNQVVSFNGSNTFVFPSNGFGTQLNVNGFTFEVWAYPNTISNGTLISEWDGTPPTGWNDSQMAFVSGNINVGVFDSNNFTPTGYITGPIFSANTWYNIVMTYDGTNLTQYINGVSISTITGVKSNPVNTYLTLGRPDVANSYLGSATGYFSGYIGLWKIWDGSLTPSQVLTNYNTYKSRYGL